MSSVVRIVLLSVLLITALGCTEDPGKPTLEPGERPSVCTTFYPLTYVVERLAGDHVDVTCPVVDAGDPSRWKSSAEAIARFQSADIVFFNGAGYEAWAKHVSIPESRVVDTSASFSDQHIASKTTQHSHGPEGDHSHTATDSNTWMDPILLKQQVAAVEKALIELLPEQRASITAARAELDAELDDIDRRLKALRAPKCLIAAQPAFAYLARRYGWSLEVLELAPGRPLTSKELGEVDHAIHHCGSGKILWPVEPDPIVVETLEEKFRLQSIVYRTGAVLSRQEARAGEDLISLLNASVGRLEAAFGN